MTQGVSPIAAHCAYLALWALKVRVPFFQYVLMHATCQLPLAHMFWLCRPTAIPAHCSECFLGAFPPLSQWSICFIFSQDSTFWIYSSSGRMSSLFVSHYWHPLYHSALLMVGIGAIVLLPASWILLFSQSTSTWLLWFSHSSVLLSPVPPNDNIYY